MKVVINKCYGGFGISRAAFLRLRELGCEAAKKEPDIGEFYDDGSGPRTGDFGDSFGRDIPRHDVLLVQVVQDMGAKANGMCAKLGIVEIPDDVSWEIVEYDGIDPVAEKHRSWS